MNTLRGRALRDDESGMTLVEVLVSMFIFALVSTGIVYTMLSILQVSRDARARQVAANLAAEEIDLARDTQNLFALLDATRDVPLNDDVFHIQRATQWVSDPNLDFSCGAGGSGSLRYKRVNVTVTWDNMRPGTQPVRSDTVIDPNVRINDPTRGTILVSVLNANGSGVGGVSVSASPSPGSTPADTDAQGCSYILKATPTNYTVSVSEPGYRDGNQNATASASVGVAAGGSASVGFLYDRAATFTGQIAAGYTPPPGVALRLPLSMPVTFWNTYGRYPRSPDSGANTRNQGFVLHPYPSGYQAFAGSCERAEPGFWAPETVPGGTLRAAPVDAVAAAPGGSATIPVPMGILTVAGGGGGGSYLRAEHVPTDASDPACTTTTLQFGNVLTASPTTIALPYGTWRLYRSSSATATGTTGTLIGSGALTTPTPAIPERTTIATDGTIRLDPRVVIP